MKATEFEQFEILFKISKLREKKKELAKKLKKLEKDGRGLSDTDVKAELTKIKEISKFSNENIKKLKERLSEGFDLYGIIKKRKEIINLIKKLKKEKRKRIEILQYLQQLDNLNEKLNVINEIAENYFEKLREDLIKIEDERLKLKKNKGKYPKTEYKSLVGGIEDKKKKLREKLAFLKNDVFSVK